MIPPGIAIVQEAILVQLLKVLHKVVMTLQQALRGLIFLFSDNFSDVTEKKY